MESRGGGPYFGSGQKVCPWEGVYHFKGVDKKFVRGGARITLMVTYLVVTVYFLQK